MTQQQQWQRYCQFLTIYPELGLSLDISRMHFAEDFLSSMEAKMQDAFTAMEELENGAIANPDEQRMVGHYWLRNPELAPDSNLGNEISASINRVKDFAQRIHSGAITPERKDRFSNVLLIGIGGSALGPQLVYDALWSPDAPMNLYFCDNTDPDGISKTLSQIGDKLDETLCLVISKSGGTVETRNGMLEVARAFTDRGLHFGHHAVAITCSGSKLDQLADEQTWLAQLYMWDWVGGRTSLFSAVGLVPAALHGADVDQFLAGAAKMDMLTRNKETLQNPAALLALMWYAAGNGKGERDMVLLPYKDRLCLFSKYLQQLVMESLGKEKDLDGATVNQGIAVYGNKGSTDQHAYVQQLRDGLNNFFVTFIEVLEDFCDFSDQRGDFEVEPGVTSGDYLSGFMLGTRRALHENDRGSVTITVDKLNAHTLGALIALYERSVGLYASLVNVNAYHQPGVEAGKKAAARVVELQHAVMKSLQSTGTSGDGLTAEELASAIGAEDESETVYKILEHLSANQDRGVLRLGERHPSQARYRLA